MIYLRYFYHPKCLICALLLWTNHQMTLSDKSHYYHGQHPVKLNSITRTFKVKSEREKERWKSHPLYKENTKVKLEAQCRSIKIPVTAALHKHELVSLICERKGEPSPPASQPLYSGSLSSVPGTASGLQRYTIPKLKNILKCHNIPPIGGKDELVLKVLLLCQGKHAAITAREESMLKDLINLTYQLIYAQRYLNLSSHVYRKRKYTLQSISPHFVPPPPHVASESDLQFLFEPLLCLLNRSEQKNQ